MAPLPAGGAGAAEPRDAFEARHPLLLALGLLALALAARLPGIDRSLWLDECFSMDMAAQAPADLARVLRERDTHPPGYYLALEAWLALFPSDLGARLFSLLASLLHVLVLGLVARRLLGARAGWVAAALAAVSSEVAWPGAEVRSFALTALLLSLAWLLALEALERGRAWRFALAALPLAGALWTFYYAALGALALLAFVIALAPPWRRLVGLLVAGLAAGLTLLPWLPTMRAQAGWVLDRTGSAGVGLEPSLSGLLDRWLAQHLFTLGPWYWIGGLLVLPVLLLAWRRRRAWGWRWAPASAERPRALTALLALVLTYLVLVLVAGLAGSFVGRRYATFLAGAWCVLAAALHARLAPRIQAWVLALLLLGGAATSIVRGLTPRHPDWRAAAAWLSAEVGPGEIVGLEPSFQILSWRHYAEPRSPPAAGLPGELPRLAGDRASRRAEAYVEARHGPRLEAWLGRREGLWLVRVTSSKRPAEDALHALLDAQGWRRERGATFRGLELERWARPPR